MVEDGRAEEDKGKDGKVEDAMATSAAMAGVTVCGTAMAATAITAAEDIVVTDTLEDMGVIAVIMDTVAITIATTATMDGSRSAQASWESSSAR